MFRIKNITKTYGDLKVLSNITLEINGGMNFIIGTSGSGKTTLLRILSGMDHDFDGDVLYHGKSIKNLSNKEKAYYYGREFGFISQNFNLIEDLTVQENILIPTYLDNKVDTKQLNSLLRKLKIDKIANQKIKTLSGGQKQRVAIARELIKNPRVIIADEPTAALDAKIAKDIIAILYEIAKERTVIVVTHDTSLISTKASVYELDKGTLTKETAMEYNKNSNKEKVKSSPIKSLSLSVSNSIKIAMVNCKRHFPKLIAMVIALLVGVSCLSINFSGVFSNSSNKSFHELIKKQGNSVLNLTLVSSFISSGDISSESLKPDEVKQDISGLIEKYQNDDRVDTLIITSSISDAVINIDEKNYTINQSGQAPVFNKIIAGKTNDNSQDEVVLPKILVDKLGIQYEDIIGKEVSFSASVFNWDSGSPVVKQVSFRAIVAGVADTSYTVLVEGNEYTFEDEDSIFLSASIVNKINEQAKRQDYNPSFSIQAKTPEDFISLYDELMSSGIVPLGQVEVIRDILSLKGATGTQTDMAYVIITVLSLFAVLSVSFIFTLMRKKEYAVYKLNGYTKTQLALIIVLENLVSLFTTLILSSVSSVLLGTSIFISYIIVLCLSILCYGINVLIATKTNVLITLKTGDR